MRVALMASDSVSVGRSPSGTRATITPTANRKPARTGVPRARDTPKKTTPVPTAKPPMVRTDRLRSSRRGVGRRATSPVSREIAPSRVRAPVATTTTQPLPEAT
jgi:hypothetical protein